MEQPEVTGADFVLAVPSLAEAEPYWCGVLGFEKRGSPPGWLFLALGGQGAMLGECADDLAPAALGSHSYFGYFRLADLDAYARAITERGAIVLAGPADKSWGMREMVVATPAGHRMMFAQRLA
ncbi:VOC family protein [Phenylobacterium sp.]|uniref:VOC family protein n=1 Tax=Phenylobacterium sp. TaxID=1871053 RepID=UPI003565D840